jgi:AraC-like DNA-binding protein
MKLTELMRQIQAASGSEPDMMALKKQCDALGIDLETIYQELEMNSAYADCHRDISREANLVKLHSHSFYELIYCTGCDNVQYIIAAERYRLQRGDIIWIPPGVSHCPLFPGTMKKPYERIVLWVNAEKMTEFFLRWQVADLQDVSRRHYLLRTAGTVWERELREVFQRCCRESEQRLTGWEAAMYSNANLLLTLLIRAKSIRGGQSLREKTELLDELMAFVAEHLHERITICDTARQLHVSESTLTHLCTRRLGLSFHRYVTQQRLDRARQLMLKSGDLAGVAELAGFCDYTAFFRAFKQEYGLSPSEYRKIYG